MYIINVYERSNNICQAFYKSLLVLKENSVQILKYNGII